MESKKINNYLNYWIDQKMMFTRGSVANWYQMMKKIEAIIRNPRARLRPTSAPSLCPPARHIYFWAIYHRDASSPTGGEEASLFIIVRSGCTLLIHHPLSLRGNCHDSSRQLPR